MEQKNLLDNNRKELLESDFLNFLRERVLNECPHVERRDMPSHDDFKSQYANPGEPFIIKHGAKTWPASSIWDFNSFAQRCGKSSIQVDLYDVTKTQSSTMQDFITSLQDPNRKSPIYLQEWWFQKEYPQFMEEVVVPDIFQDDFNLKLLGFYNATLWIGAAGAQTRVHQDSVFVNIWTTQLQGKKEWIIFSRDAVLKAGSDGKPDYDEFLANPANKVQYAHLEAGDIMYVPYKWWHRAQTISDAISMNTFYITEDIVQRYIKNVMAIPLAACLNKDLLMEKDPMRYNVSIERVRILSELMGFDPDNILGLDLQEGTQLTRQQLEANNVA